MLRSLSSWPAQHLLHEASLLIVLESFLTPRRPTGRTSKRVLFYALGARALACLLGLHAKRVPDTVLNFSKLA